MLCYIGSTTRATNSVSLTTESSECIITKRWHFLVPSIAILILFLARGFLQFDVSDLRVQKSVKGGVNHQLSTETLGCDHNLENQTYSRFGNQ
jgi:hypothetical protein